MADVDQVAQLLRSIEEQQATTGVAFPLHGRLLMLRTLSLSRPWLLHVAHSLTCLL